MSATPRQRRPPELSLGRAGGELAEQIRSRAELFPELSQALSGPAPALADNARQFGLDRILGGLAGIIARRP
jgi:hypothetical protein